MVSITPRPLYRRKKSPQYPFNERLGGLQSRSGRLGEQKNSQSPLGIESMNPVRPARAVSMLNEPSRSGPSA